MPNIFDGINKMNDSEIIEQIAIMETMNRTNLSKPIFLKAVKKAVNVINYIGNKIGKDPNVREPEVKEIWTMLEETKEELKTLTRKELDDRLREILMEKSKIKSDIPSDDELSVAVIEESCRLFGISPRMMPGRKADIIYSKLDGNYINDEYVEEDEDKSSDVKVIDAPNVSILKMGRKFDRQVLSKLVYLSVKAYEKDFSPSAKDMPSFKTNEAKEEEKKKEEYIQALRKELTQRKESLKEGEAKINEQSKTIRNEKASIKGLEKIKKDSENEIKNGISKKEKLAEEMESLNELIEQLEVERVNASLDHLDKVMEKYEEVKLRVFDIKSEINSIDHEITYKQDLIQNCMKDIENKEKTLEDTEKSKAENEENYKKFAEEYNSRAEELKCIEKEKKQAILIKWKDSFDRITFEENDLKNIAKYSNDEIIEIEKCVYELNNTKDPSALSGGIIKDGSDRYEYIEAEADNGFRFEIWFEVYEGSGRNIHIAEIV